MNDPAILALIAPAAIAATALAAVTVIALAGLKAWHDWLALQRVALERPAAAPVSGSASARIELADLKERVRKLEAIAAGVDP